MKKLVVYLLVGLMAVTALDFPSIAAIDFEENTVEDVAFGEAPSLQDELEVQEEVPEAAKDQAQGTLTKSYSLHGYLGSQDDFSFVPNDGKVKIIVMGGRQYMQDVLADLKAVMIRPEASNVQAYVIDTKVTSAPSEEDKQYVRQLEAPSNMHITYQKDDGTLMYYDCVYKSMGSGGYTIPLVVYVNGKGEVYSWQDRKSLTDFESQLKRGGINIEYQLMTIAYRSQWDIINYVNSVGAIVSAPTVYDRNPLISAPYDPGQLSIFTQAQALGMLNQIRYIAGLHADVTLNNDYVEKAQAAALVNYANGTLSHYPTQPGGMSNELYQKGYTGASNSNIAYASWNRAINETTIFGWMGDADESNRSRVGHRRWILNPAMAQTGFGVVTGGATYSAMYALDRSAGNSEKGVAWPAQNMPVEYFRNDIPWSFSTGMTEDMTKVGVVLTNESTGQTWRFSQFASDGYFNVDNGGYGLKGCVIFVPNGFTMAKGDGYKVQITGLEKGSVEYRVNFFSLSDNVPEPTPVFGWYHSGGKSYWYENSIRQGTYWDPQGVLGDGTIRGREIYDPVSDAWYWLDSCYDGAKAVGKEVWVPYVYQGEQNWNAADIDREAKRSGTLADHVKDAITSRQGKWIRYDEQGRMVKGWFTVTLENQHLYPGQLGNTYYYENITGIMIKGWAKIDGRDCYFDPVTGAFDPYKTK